MMTSAESAPRADVDLHAHTTASDGTATPEQFVAAALAAGLSAVAVTDHDTVDGVGPVTEAAAGTGLRIVPGVELSAHDADGREVHLLGLHLSAPHVIAGSLARAREDREMRATQMVARLNSEGIAITADDVREAAAGAAIGRPHIARVLVARGIVKTMQEAFDRWLGAGKPAYVEKPRLPVDDAIAMVHAAGGLAVYAHPGEAGTRERVGAFAAAGLDGLEVRHPSHSAAEIKRLRGLARDLGLVPSGGSDWHGAAAGPRALGSMRVTADWLALHDQAVANRAAGRAGPPLA
ncbi:MAG: PHP domain-containing protein [Gemmatimonadetes bacterium]|nr:PHP domain-containing protein [Gemmatimonadota bacterium]